MAQNDEEDEKLQQAILMSLGVDEGQPNTAHSPEAEPHTQRDHSRQERQEGLTPELSRLAQVYCRCRPAFVKLCLKIAKNASTKGEKYRTLNDKKLQSRCPGNEYGTLCEFLRVCGFNRVPVDGEDKWLLGERFDAAKLQQICEILNYAMSQSASLRSHIGVWPSDHGKLIVENIELWAKSSLTHSINNKRSAMNWGDYRVTITFVNESNKTIRVKWMNWGGKEREPGATISPGRQTMYRSQLNHPYVIRDSSGKAIGGYEPTIRGRDAHHVVVIGDRVTTNGVKQTAARVIKDTDPDKRDIPAAGPPPPPPPPSERPPGWP